MKKGLGEIVFEAAKASSKAAKIEILRRNDVNVLRGIFQLAYDNNIKWALPEGNPPFKKLDKTFDAQGNLFKEMRKMYLFIEGGNDNLKPARREVLFISLLEELDPDDAELILQCKNRNIPGLPKAVVQEAFPDFLNDPSNVVKSTKVKKQEQA